MKFDRFQWQRAVMSSENGLSKITKYTLLSTSIYMNGDGVCWPAIRTLAGNMSMSKTSVHKHIQTAVQEGWLLPIKQDFEGKGWKRSVYQASFPNGFCAESVDIVYQQVVHDKIEGVPAESEGVPADASSCTRSWYLTDKEQNKEQRDCDSPSFLKTENQAEAESPAPPCEAKSHFADSSTHQNPKTSDDERPSSFSPPGCAPPPSSQTPKQAIADAAAKEAIEYFNKKTGQKCNTTDKIVELVGKRIAEGLTLGDLKRATDNIVSIWRDSPKMSGQVRPSVIFGIRCDEYSNIQTKKNNISSIGEFNYEISD